MNSKENHGWPFLISASRYAPTRLLLAPPIEVGIDAVRLMNTGPRSQTGPTTPTIRVGEIGDFEVFVSETLLIGPELGEPSSFIPRDAFGRRIVVKRGVCVNREAGISPASLLVNAEEQFLAALRYAWLGGEETLTSQLLQGDPRETSVAALNSSSYEQVETPDVPLIPPLAPMPPLGHRAWVTHGRGLRRMILLAIAIAVILVTIFALFLIAGL